MNELSSRPLTQTAPSSKVPKNGPRSAANKPKNDTDLQDISGPQTSVRNFIFSLFSAAVLGFLLLGAVGCGRLSAGSSRGPGSGNDQVFRNASDDLEASTAAATIRCAEMSNAACPGYVALLLSLKADPKTGQMITFQCTGFLIANDLLITNTHCLDQSIRRPGSSCRSSISFTFPETPTLPAGKATCDQVVQLAQIPESEKDFNPLLPDYAVLRLSHPVDRGVARLSHGGLEEQLKVHVFAIDPPPPSGKKEIHIKAGQKISDGTLRVKTCTIVQKTDADPSFTAATDKVGTAASCGAVIGNSGSPVLDPQGLVRGVVYLIEDFAKTANGIALPQLTYITNLDELNLSLPEASLAPGTGTTSNAASNPASGPLASQNALPSRQAGSSASPYEAEPAVAVVR